MLRVLILYAVSVLWLAVVWGCSVSLRMVREAPRTVSGAENLYGDSAFEGKWRESDKLWGKSADEKEAATLLE
jgi:hypothetical protein